MPEKYENKSKEDGKNGETENNLKGKVEGLETTQKSEGKQDNKKEKIVTTETSEKIEGTEMPEKYEWQPSNEKEKIVTTETPVKAEENKSPAKINITEESLGKIYQTQDPEKIDEYGILQDVDNLLTIENFKIAESQEETDDKDGGRNLFEEIAKMQRRQFFNYFYKLRVNYHLNCELVHFGTFWDLTRNKFWKKLKIIIFQF